MRASAKVAAPGIGLRACGAAWLKARRRLRAFGLPAFHAHPHENADTVVTGLPEQGSGYRRVHPARKCDDYLFLQGHIVILEAPDRESSPV